MLNTKEIQRKTKEIRRAERAGRKYWSIPRKTKENAARAARRKIWVSAKEIQRKTKENVARAARRKKYG